MGSKVKRFANNHLRPSWPIAIKYTCKYLRHKFSQLFLNFTVVTVFKTISASKGEMNKIEWKPTFFQKIMEIKSD